MTQEGTKRKLTAILSADVKEYSRLMSQDERGTIRTLTAYKEAMSMLIQEYKGRVVDSPGDNLLAEFGSVVDAVNCAVEIQRELAERNAELPPAREMEFRVGINVGDIVEEEKRICGDGVNIAARVESLAEGGGICISGNVHEQVKNRIGLEYEYLGEQAVKNIPEPVHVYRVLSFPGAAAHRVVKARKTEGMKWRKTALAIALVLVVGAAAVAVWNFFLRPTPPAVEPASVEKMAFPLPDKPSIAVLPFVNMSEDPKQEYFSDGITEDLITDLSGISGVFVIARNSTFAYKGKAVKIQQVAEELGVRYVLEGSVRKADNRVRINAQLVDATTGRHLWAKRYDGKLDDIFDLQDEITRKIVTALAVKLTTDEKEEVSRKYTDNPAAYDVLLKGMEHYYRFTAEDFAEAATYFEKAIELDPNYGRAYAALAAVYWWCTEQRWAASVYLGVPDFEAYLRPRRYMQMAKKNPSPTMHRVAVDMLLRKRLHKEAIAEAEHALALDPNNAESHRTMGRALIFDGRQEEAVDFMKTAMRLDPLYPATYLWNLGLAYFCMGQYEKAVTSLERAITLNPKAHQFSGVLAAAYAHLGRDEQAREALEKFRGISPITLGELMYRHPFKDPETAERFASGFLKAGMPGKPSGYYKIYEENKLAGEEIRKLVFGQKVSIVLPEIRYSRVTRTIDGKATIESVPVSGRGKSWRGKSWIEDDMLCDKWEETLPLFGGFEWCGTVFRNPEYKSEMFDEYLWVTDFEVHGFSLVE